MLITKSIKLKNVFALMVGLSFFSGATPAQADQEVELAYLCRIGYYDQDSTYYSTPNDRECTSSVNFVVTEPDTQFPHLVPVPVTCTVKAGENDCFVEKTITLPDGNIDPENVRAFTSPNIGQYETRKKCVHTFGNPGVTFYGVVGGKYAFLTNKGYTCATPRDTVREIVRINPAIRLR